MSEAKTAGAEHPAPWRWTCRPAGDGTQHQPPGTIDALVDRDGRLVIGADTSNDREAITDGEIEIASDLAAEQIRHRTRDRAPAGMNDDPDTDDFDDRLATALFNAGMSGPCTKPVSAHSIERCALKAGHPPPCRPRWAVLPEVGDRDDQTAG